MPTLSVDGKTYEFEGKKNILQVALENDHEIPHYCYHEGLSVTASCRICLAEVYAPNPRNEGKMGPWPGPAPKLVPTCQSPALDGMQVMTQSPKAIANQKIVMELLLINHPLDCPVCDQAGECKLQDYSYEYGRSQSRFEEQKIKQPVKDIGPYVKLYSDRCIMCTRCVRFTQEITGSNELGVFGRGSSEQIDIFPGMPLANELSGNVVDLCPVGALLDKDFLFTQRVWFLSKTPSIDGITASGDNLWVEHNEGRVYRLKPRSNPKVNQWWITDEVRYGWKFTQDENRLNKPMKWQYGNQVVVDWDIAIREANQGLTKAAKEGGRIAVIVSPMLSCEEAHLLGKYARAIDPQAILALGQVPIEGEDKTTQSGFHLSAEKCPNRRGVQRVLEKLGGEVLDCDQVIGKLADKKNNVTGVVLTGNYPNSWLNKEMTKALSKKFVVLIDTLPQAFTVKASIVLPSATWLEKSGTFENHQSRLQIFEQAIPVLEGARTEGQIALNLLTQAKAIKPCIFDAKQVRQELGDDFNQAACQPKAKGGVESAMEYVEL